MFQSFDILARGAEDDFVKVIIGIIVFVIWGIGALAKLSKNQGKASQRAQNEMDRAIQEQLEQVRRRQIEELSGQSGRISPPPIPPALQRSRSMPQMRTNPVPVAPSAKKKRGQKRGKAPAVPIPAEPDVPRGLVAARQDFESQTSTGDAATSPTRQVLQNATGIDLRLTPQKLRQQFILTEILQPPLALRDQ